MNSWVEKKQERKRAKKKSTSVKSWDAVQVYPWSLIAYSSKKFLFYIYD